ncbi:MAG: metalloprotease TldD [Rhodobiaceae bacterium]|nr:metalloprotease TldD [Rhodobiaceae bacterium]
MTETESAGDLLERGGVALEEARRILADGLGNADDGDLFVQSAQSESLVFDNGRLRQSSFDRSGGFGMRAIAGASAGHAHGNTVSRDALERAADSVRAAGAGYSGTVADSPPRTNRRLYEDADPINNPQFAQRVALVEAIDAFARQCDPRVQQVTVSLAASRSAVGILRADGNWYEDARPLIRLNVSVVVSDGKRRESGSAGHGGRADFDSLLSTHSWQDMARDAVRQALVNLDARPAPAGTFDIALGPGWPGVLLHEAVGHGLEGDFVRKKQSAFAGLVGERVAAPGVTVVDDGTLSGRRGSITIDDEGTPSGETVLIEDGRLVGFMQDRQNARLMGVKPTGNGRRESYAHSLMPRMTNTYMRSGEYDPEEIVASIDGGLYAVGFGGGQVDITSGKFVFECTEAYWVEKGRIVHPVKGAMLIGNGPDALTRVRMVGNDMKLDPGIGTCGKQGQSVPVGVGQPTLRIDRMTVGGTEQR